jgi:hypothetical protein
MCFRSYIKGLVLTLLLVVVAGCSGSSTSGLTSAAGVGTKKAGKVLVNDQQMTTDLNDQSQPSVAYDTVNHQYLMVWTDSRNPSGIYGKIAQGKSLYDDGSYNPTTGTGGILAPDNDPRVQPNKPDGWPKVGTPPLTLKPDFAISTGTGNQSQPKVAFYPDPTNPKYLVVWTDSRNGYSQIYGQFLKADGTYLKKDAQTASVDALGNPVPDNFPITSHVGTAPTGTITVQGAFSQQISNGAVFANHSSVSVTGVGTTFATRGISSNDFFVINGVYYTVGNVVSDTALNLSTPYTGPSAGNLSYLSYGIRTPSKDVVGGVDSQGNTTHFTNSKPGDMLGVDGFFYEIASITDDQHLTLKTTPDNTFSGTYSSYQITSHLGQVDPDIIFNPVTGKFVVAWMDTTSFDTDHTQVVSGAGCNNSAVANYLAYFAGAADTNEVMTAEISPQTGAPIIPIPKPGSSFVWGASMWADSGSAITSSWNVQVNEAKPKLAFNPATGDIYLAWSGIAQTSTLTIPYKKDKNNNCSYLTETWAVTGKDPTQNIKLRNDPGLGFVQDYHFGTNAVAPALATDPFTGRLLVAWEEDSKSGTTQGKDILGQLVDLASFTSYGSTLNISTAVGDQTSPVAAYDSVNQRFFVAWEDARNQSANISNMDIYGQFIDPQGNLSGANAIVTVNPANQIAPAVVFGDVFFRKFLVLWKDGRLNNNADIYGQMMEYSVSPQLTITDATGNPILNGAIDFGNVQTGSTLDIPIKLRNDGNQQLTIFSMTVPDAPFSFVTPTPVTINPGTSYDLTVEFAPKAAGSYAGNPTNNFKTVINSDGGQSILYFSGSGVGVNPLSISTTSLPDASVNTPYSFAMTAAGGVFPYTWSATGLPSTMGISAGGVISGMATTPKGYDVTVTVTDNASPTKIQATRTLHLNVGSLAITTSSLPAWTQGQAYPTQTLQATGGTAPYKWAVVPGTQQIVTGLTLDTDGTLHGTATASGSPNLTVQVTDSLGQVATRNLPLVINPPPSITTTILDPGVVGKAYKKSLAFSGGTAPLVWSMPGSVSLPVGLSFDPGTGTISGTPTAATDPKKPTKVDFMLTDATNASSRVTLEIDINPVLDIQNPTTGTGSPGSQTIYVGTPYTYTFNAIGGTIPYNWSILPGGSLPLGLSLNQFTGAVTGTPTSIGTYSFIIQVVDANGTAVPKTYTMTASVPVTITTTSLKSWTKGQDYTAGTAMALAATGGSGTYTWAVTAGNLPTPLSLDKSTGAITGTPDTAGTYTFTVAATDTSKPPLSASKQFTVIINYVPAITTTTLADVTKGIKYTQPLSASGGLTPLSWSIKTGDILPAGITLDSQTGKLGGTATTVGTSTFTVQVTDAAGATATQSLTLNVTASGGGGGGGGGTSIAPSTGGGGGGCFIATAAYGSYLDPHVMVLRHFRDNVLLKSELGTAFVRFYYRTSPPVADFIHHHEALRLVFRWTLTPLIFAVEYSYAAIGLLLALCCAAVRFKRARTGV